MKTVCMSDLKERIIKVELYASWERFSYWIPCYWYNGLLCLSYQVGIHESISLYMIPKVVSFLDVGLEWTAPSKRYLVGRLPPDHKKIMSWLRLIITSGSATVFVHIV